MDMYKGRNECFGGRISIPASEIFRMRRTSTLTGVWMPREDRSFRGIGRNRRDLPWRENQDAYRIWISEIMLQQTRVEASKTVLPASWNTFRPCRRWRIVEEEELFKCWEGLGYYSRRNLEKRQRSSSPNTEERFRQTTRRFSYFRDRKLHGGSDRLHRVWSSCPCS